MPFFDDQARRVAERDGGRVRIGTVGDDLHLHWHAVADRGLVAGRDRERQPRTPALQVVVDLLYGVHRTDHREIRGRLEPRHQLAAERAAIAVCHNHRNVTDVRRRRIAKHRQLDDGRHDDDAEEPRIEPELEQLLPDEEAQALHYAFSLASRKDASPSIAIA
jgi:hypothetical protein